MELPRVTGSLRLCAGLTEEPTPIYESVEERLFQKNKKAAERQLSNENGLPWGDLQQAICNGVLASSKVKELLKEFKLFVKDAIGEETTFSTVDAAAASVFKLFYEQQGLGANQFSEMNRLFGPLDRSLIERLSYIVREIISLTPPEVIKSAMVTDKQSEEKFSNSFFGSDFHFNAHELLHFVDEFDCTVDEQDDFQKLSMKYVEPKPVVKIVSDIAKSKDVNYDAKWVKREVLDSFKESGEILGKQGLVDICSSVYGLLCSEHSDEALQNELFELLGFDRFELIQLLLKNRSKVMNFYATNGPGPSVNLESFKTDSKLAVTKGIGITVQSEQEKFIRKWARKEEKKLQRAVDGNDPELESDVKFLRNERETVVKASMQSPIFSLRGVTQRHNYPHVYDTNNSITGMAGFVGGRKIMLPEGIERTNNNMYEMVDIPPVSAGSAGIPKTLVPISSLDEIGQLAFAGVKHLNRIQSVVFEAAYHTNGNLLICAPTGAGKTNIAMLCILKEIKQHMEGGKIKLNDFKIVYIAPMKALAAEMVQNFGKRLAPLGVKVRELTGDMQLTKSEIKETQMIVTTPEKWDVVTRKSVGDVALSLLVKLLIIDEVHLLHGERGPVLETLVARTLRQVETSQTMIRLVGLSATLPNYVDVATFLSVNPYTGLFYFDGRFRPVPLGMTFIGVKALNPMQQIKDMDVICYERIFKLVSKGHQVMVFVHARNGTVRTATVLKDLALNQGNSEMFSVEHVKDFGISLKQVMRSRNKQLRELFPYGFSFHHAGMLRQDRNLVEKLFSAGLIKVLVCTATLAWGVNLPAHAVIIKGTELYDAKHGSYVDLGILDVMQIFGRAGRPQYDTSGHGTIITSHDKLAHYLSLLTCQYPIESQFIQSLVDNLNAEVALGTVTNVEEAAHWLSYTYLHIRINANPIAYGISYGTLMEDPELINTRKDLIITAARELEKAKMIRFEEATGYMFITDLGRTASHFYIKHATVETFNDILKSVMSDAEVLAMVSQSQEFEQLKVRDDELEELDEQVHYSCKLPVPGGPENPHGKVNILLQTFISHGKLNSFSLISDQAYILQNATRIMRALFEVVLRKNWSIMAGRLLTLCKVLEHQSWSFEHPLRQFTCLSYEILSKLEKYSLNLDKLRELPADEIGHFVRHKNMGVVVKRCVSELPVLGLEATIHPITRSVLRVHLTITAEFRWNDHVHGKNAESFWIWVEDPNTNHMYHSECFTLTKKQVIKDEKQVLVFTIPIFEPLPTQYIVHAESDRWLGSSSACPISFQHLILPERHPPNTDLLDLRPLPVSALQDSNLQSIYNFSHFNPIQTQIFHLLYYSDTNILLGAPTGSGKTIVAEIAMFRTFSVYPGAKVVYIAPLKALVRERIDDWKVRLENRLNRKVVELTGDVTPDIRAIENADVIVTTPEKWDGISRSWQTRNYVKTVALIVIDEIHLLGEDRGPVLEVIVSRTNFITSHTGRKLRVIGLSTALANARDLADWLGINSAGLYNFRPSVRPVPMEVHIQGFPGKHYCPRMATMNKPIYRAIRSHSPKKPALVFVSSRRQTRLTALDLIAYLAVESNPKQWLNMPEDEMDAIITSIKDTNLKLTLSFGIAIHHAGLQERDRKTVEQLFVEGKIQVLIATATLAWGVNFPAHLVVVKGTEYFDGKKHRYVDFPITDVLQMIGRAGRPQFDDHGVAVVLVHDLKKHFYKKFLYEPFPVESSLLQVLEDHINAEIVAGTINSKQEAMDYLTWTYFFRRLLQNPTYYDLEVLENENINNYLSKIINNTINVLEQSGCVEVDEDNRTFIPTTIGRIASYYYLGHKTVLMFKEKLSPTTKLDELLNIVSNANEYAELPVRHNEDGINGEFAKVCPIAVDPLTYDSPHTKAHLLFQAHFSRLTLPCTDYITDQKSVLDQAIRILQALIDIVADQGWLSTTLLAINMIQMVVQARWIHDDPFLTLPHLEENSLYCFTKGQRKHSDAAMFTRHGNCLPRLMASCRTYESLAVYLRREFDERQIENVFEVLKKLPIINVKLNIAEHFEKGNGRQHNIHLDPYEGKRPESHWVRVLAEQEYTLNVDVARVNFLRRNDYRAHAPKFPKVKDEGWILVLGDPDKREVLALKRIGFANAKHSYRLDFFTPKRTGRVIYNLYFMSDCYLGLDQQYELCLEVQ